MAESMVALIGLSLFRVAFARLALLLPASCSIARDAVILSLPSRAATAAFVGVADFCTVATGLVAVGGVEAVTGVSVAGGVATVEGVSAVGIGVEAGTEVSVLAGGFRASAIVGVLSAGTCSGGMSF